MTALNDTKDCGPSIFCGFEPLLFATIKEGVSVNPRECAKATSFSINDLYFWLSKQTCACQVQIFGMQVFSNYLCLPILNQLALVFDIANDDNLV